MKSSTDNQQKVVAVDSSKGASAEAIATEAQKQQKNFVSMELSKISQTQWVCAGQLPPGWLKIGGQWNPTSCGNPTTIYETYGLLKDTMINR